MIDDNIVTFEIAIKVNSKKFALRIEHTNIEPQKDFETRIDLLFKMARQTLVEKYNLTT